MKGMKVKKKIVCKKSPPYSAFHLLLTTAVKKDNCKQLFHRLTSVLIDRWRIRGLQIWKWRWTKIDARTQIASQ